jgi:hypothetical protein
MSNESVFVKIKVTSFLPPYTEVYGCPSTMFTQVDSKNGIVLAKGVGSYCI